MKSIFTNENFFNLSDPQTTWLYDVIFYKKIDSENESSYVEDSHLFVDTITLPQYETEIVTKSYFGSERSYPVLRTYGTDVELGFTLRSDWNDNKQIFRLAQINARNLKNSIKFERDSILYPVHPEIEKYNSSIGTINYNTINKIEIRLRTKTGQTLKRSGRTGKLLDTEDQTNYSDSTSLYTFYNCILTNFSFDSDLSYESEDMLKCKITFHSDIWSHANNDVDYKK